MLEMDWKEVTVTFNDNKINFPRVVTIKLQGKIKVRHLMKRECLLFHLMLKQGITSKGKGTRQDTEGCRFKSCLALHFSSS